MNLPNPTKKKNTTDDSFVLVQNERKKTVWSSIMFRKDIFFYVLVLANVLVLSEVVRLTKSQAKMEEAIDNLRLECATPRKIYSSRKFTSEKNEDKNKESINQEEVERIVSNQRTLKNLYENTDSMGTSRHPHSSSDSKDTKPLQYVWPSFIGIVYICVLTLLLCEALCSFRNHDYPFSEFM